MTIDLMYREISGKNAQKLFDRYLTSIRKYGYRQSIKECYKNPSKDRLKVEEQYKRYFSNISNASGYTVISATNYGFSVGFIVNYQAGYLLIVLTPYFVGFIDLSKVGY